MGGYSDWGGARVVCVCVCYLIIKTGYDMTREVRVLSTRLWVGVMGHERTQTRDQGGVGAVGHERTWTHDQGGVGAVGHERTWARDRGRDKRIRADHVMRVAMHAGDRWAI